MRVKMNTLHIERLVRRTDIARVAVCDPRQTFGAVALAYDPGATTSTLGVQSMAHRDAPKSTLFSVEKESVAYEAVRLPEAIVKPPRRRVVGARVPIDASPFILAGEPDNVLDQRQTNASPPRGGRDI
jgi:hypothetical protein